METMTAYEFLKLKKYPELREELATMEPADIAALLECAEIEDIPRFYRILPKDLAAETFAEMDGDMQELLIKAFSDSELSEILEEMFLDDTVDMIEEMPAIIVKRILRVAKPEQRQAINELLHYPSDSVGSIMTIEYVSLKKMMTVAQAFERIRRIALDSETIYNCYVTDQSRKLLGIVTAKDLMLSASDQVIGDIMDEDVISVSTHDDREEVARLIDKYGFLAMPVVDAENRLVGIVTVDDAIDVIQEEHEEDIAIMSAVTPSEETYFKTSVFSHAKNRILWLVILMMAATFTGLIITAYEEAMSAMLVSFIPMLMNTGGNCGAQSSAMIIRGLSVEEIRLRDFFRVLTKEIRIALIVGASLMVVSSVQTLVMYELVYKRTGVYGDTNIFLVCVVVGLSLMGAVLLAKTLGCCLPMLAKRMHLDPAMMASPFITTIVDACSVLIYFNIAIRVLRI